VLRSYQRDALEAAQRHISESFDSFVIEAATGAGKSHIIAALSEWLWNVSGKRVLCLAPSKELIEQNHKKFLATGHPASIFSSSAGQKSLRHHVVFGTPGTVINALDRFANFAAVIVDECHGITPTIKKIIADLKKKNPKLRVVGFTATPYRMNTGYIYKINMDGTPTDHDGYYTKLIYSIQARELIAMGYLTPPTTEATSEHYATAALEVNRMGKFDAAEVERAFEGHGRKTAYIVADVVRFSANRKGVLLFAATVQHAQEILSSLPPHNSAIVTGITGKREREKILADFHARRIKYLVNVAVLTTGFDAPHVDVIALLRATESASLLQQIIGRGLRLSEGKRDCLILDYAENIERHCPDGDLFNPEIKDPRVAPGGAPIEVRCPECSLWQQFKPRRNDEGFGYSEDGYFVDLAGTKTSTPSHYGRRCTGFIKVGWNYERCSYRWTLKECPKCDHENDIAARRCERCKAEMVDPNEKLRLEFARIKSDPYSASSDLVLNWSAKKWVSKKGNVTLKVDFVTECRSFSVWYMPESGRQWRELCIAAHGEVVPTVDDFLAKRPSLEIKRVTAMKSKSTGFYTVLNYNEEVQNEV